MSKIQYFLGGNTPSGFYSLYHQLSDPERFRALYIIKSGPGSGKSSLMRRVGRHAQAAGLETQEILCSGDPDSLDALILPQLGAAIVDGTAPQGAVPLVHFGPCGWYRDVVVVPEFWHFLELPADLDFLFSGLWVPLADLDAVNQPHHQLPGDALQL